MPSIVPYTLALAGLVLTASLVVLGETNHEKCAILANCTHCTSTKINTTGDPNATIGNKGNCVWESTSGGQICTDKFEGSQETVSVVYDVSGCRTDPPAPTTAAPNTTSTTPATPTTTAPSNGTTPSTTAVPTTPAPANTTTTTTVSPPTNTTTIPSSTTTAVPSNGTTPVTTPGPTSSTTPTPGPKPTPAPKTGGFSWASFIGGIVFAAALSSLAYLIFRFYKVRLDRNYHTLSTNLI